MKIVMIASEARPFCKTGGLADVTYSLSKELASMGEDVSIILPFYDTVRKNPKFSFSKCTDVEIRMSWRHQKLDVYESSSDGVKYYFINSDQYYSRGHLYGDFDDGERFAAFCHAAKALIIKLAMNPDIVHCHDWQTGMIPFMLKEGENKELFTKTKTVLTIHNPAFQGLLPQFCLGDLYNFTDDYFYNGSVRLKDQVSTLKAGIFYADKITTVSPTHRCELLTPEGSMGLSGDLQLREGDFCGFLNGIDYNEFNPGCDKNIAKEYSSNNIITSKKENKKKLFDMMGLKDYKRPLYSIVSRITWQKGFDIMEPTVYELIRRGCNVVLVGSGEYDQEQKWQDIRNRFPNNIGIYIGYNDALAHLVYASSDFFLMPSLFEPCGLGQMIAQRYGTLPIVRRTGGLKDSVINFDSSNELTSNGFGFDNYSSEDLKYTSIYAYDTWFNRKLFRRLCQNAMKTDNTWKKSATLYLGLYKSMR
ncbi:MAG: glycogen synthase [Bacilli bacterium]|nr:glycogen synthase [Bacilli bacterium]